MKIERISSVPIITHDPYFSIWCSNDKLNIDDLKHWSGSYQTIRGYIIINGNEYCFMGNPENYDIINQINCELNALSTEYTFENEDVVLKVKFISPLLLEEPLLVSRPCTYIDYQVERKKEDLDISIRIDIHSNIVSLNKSEIIGDIFNTQEYKYAMMGKAQQTPLSHSGDNITIDWGYVYLSAKDENSSFEFNKEKQILSGNIELKKNKTIGSHIISYDDLLSINYFGEWKKAYWTNFYSTILEAIDASWKDKNKIIEKCNSFDITLEEKASNIGGEDYKLLCNTSYRQSICAHKLITDDNGDLIFLSKENDSNGCIGTVDVSYPSIPLFLLFNTEYVKGMLRPIYSFCNMPVWDYDFAPHDVGRYPYAWGQVYGLNSKKGAFNGDNGFVYPPFYQYPDKCNYYDFNMQMPLEECGNMLIMTAVVCRLDNSADFAIPHMKVLQQWTEYLLKYGKDPEEQLCTDDFAGHLSHNVNLSAKAIMGVESFALLQKQLGNIVMYEEYHKKAQDMAIDWVERASTIDHTSLVFTDKESWSLKYNLIWDVFFESNLFPKEIFKTEIDYYIKKTNKYGVPLDSRKEYTKSDWILWCASMAENDKMKELIKPVARYLKETESRVPFSDWYETVSGNYIHFIGRSVQGGIFMPMLIKK